MKKSQQDNRAAARGTRFLRVCALLGAAALAMSCSVDDITTREDKVIARITPDRRVDTSFVGDVIDYPLPFFFTASVSDAGVGGFNVQWSTSNSSVASKQGSQLQQVPLVCGQAAVVFQVGACVNDNARAQIAVTGPGEATLTLIPTGVRVAPGVSFQHKLYVLAAPPDILDAPAFLRIKLGDATLLYAPPRNSTGPLITTGTTTWVATQPTIAAVQPIENISNPTLIQVLSQSGDLVSSPTLPVIVKGKTAGQSSVVAIWSNGIRRIQKTVTIIVVPPSVTIAAVPPGPANDLSNSQTPVVVGQTRQYRALDEDDNGVNATWTSIPPASGPTIADITPTGLAICRAPGTAQIRASRTGTSFTQTVSLVCFVPPQPGFAVTPSVLALATGGGNSLTTDVRNVGATFSIAWTSRDPSIVTVTPNPPLSAFVSGASRLIRGTSTYVVAELTAGTISLRDSSLITVAPAPLTVTPGALPALAQGASQTFTLNVGPANSTLPVANSEITWSVTNGAIASVTSAGIARCSFGTPGGTVSVVATVNGTNGTRAASAPLTCLPPPIVPVARIVILPANRSVAVGSPAIQYIVVYLSATGDTLPPEPASVTEFSTDVSTVAGINISSGLLDVRAAGTTSVQAFYRVTGRTTLIATTNLTVTGPVAGFSLTPGSVSVVQGAAATQASIGVMRTGGFTGAMGAFATYTPPGSTTPGALPTGLTVNATATTFSGNALTFNVSATTTVSPRSYPITITTSSGLAAQSTTLTVVVTAATAGSQVVLVVLDPMGLELTPPFNINPLGSFVYVAHLFNAAGNEITAGSDGGAVTYTVGSTSVMLVNSRTPTATGQAPLGAAIPGNAGTTTVTAVYSRGTTVVASSAPSSVTVYPVAGGRYSTVAVQMPVGSSEYPTTLRQVRVGQPVQFDLVIRDQNGASVPFNADQGIGFTMSSTAIQVSTRQVVGANTMRYTLTATALPGTTVIPGLPNVVTLQVDIDGAMVRIPIIIVP